VDFDIGRRIVETARDTKQYFEGAEASDCCRKPTAMYCTSRSFGSQDS
jgi:hypothetical protein